jgi:hypothetical protein
MQLEAKEPTLAGFAPIRAVFPQQADTAMT